MAINQTLRDALSASLCAAAEPDRETLLEQRAARIAAFGVYLETQP